MRKLLVLMLSLVLVAVLSGSVLGSTAKPIRTVPVRALHPDVRPVTYVTEYTVTAIVPVPVYKGRYQTPTPVIPAPYYPAPIIPAYYAANNPVCTAPPPYACPRDRGLCLGLLRSPFRLISSVEYILFGE
jgi:hypothetical protein